MDGNMYTPDPKRPGHCLYESSWKDGCLLGCFFICACFMGCTIAFVEQSSAHRDHQKALQDAEWRAKNSSIRAAAREEEKAKCAVVTTVTKELH